MHSSEESQKAIQLALDLSVMARKLVYEGMVNKNDVVIFDGFRTLGKIEGLAEAARISSNKQLMFELEKIAVNTDRLIYE